MQNENLRGLEDYILANISHWEALQEYAQSEPDSLKIFGVDWFSALTKQAGASPKGDLKALLGLARKQGVSSLEQDCIWTWERFPYTIRQAGLKLPRSQETCGQADAGGGPRHPELVVDIDEWVLRNEAYLRLLSRKLNLSRNIGSKPWTYGLVRLDQLPIVLSQSYDLSTKRLAINRASSLSGFCVLGDKRGTKILTQPSQKTFDLSWSQMTGDVLRGLNWSNLFAAGGSVLGTLITPSGEEEVHMKEDWLGSDIDLFIWGLSAHEANRKIDHIAETYRRNLPQDAPFVVAKNSHTITFYSAWPTKRVQIVLKLVKNPRDVLLNFDLDPCAIGYDGSKVWMLPRFVRSLETGYTTFTMDLIHGHYLGDRKATRDKRVFKYANKGFGLRILPSYLSSCGNLDASLAAVRSTSNEARLWTTRFLDFHESSKFFSNKQTSSEQDFPPQYTHSQLYMNGLVPADGCLSNLTLFMRHVALWEQDVLGKIRIRDNTCAYAGKEEGDEGYYNADPPYRWSRDFSIPEFREHLDAYNARLTTQVEETVEYVLFRPRASLGFSVKRVTHDSSVSGILSRENDLKVPLVMHKDMVLFANKLILAALEKHGIGNAEPPLHVVYEDDAWSSRRLCLVAWNIDPVLNWQLLDRSIDEVREVMWEFSKRLANRMVGDWDLFEYQERAIARKSDCGFTEWVSETP
ncbi:hypothetical protein V5O48_017991 [Marasmius crinis-equi]|uniref:Uncharacterized protein n=1 Tax=Marasmius crinis-equi TaxID=585013 RepID=A0ABR3EML7_9AGAR